MTKLTLRVAVILLILLIPTSMMAADVEQLEIDITVTAYTLKECHRNKGVTASGPMVRPGVAAVSRDLERLGLSLGSTVKFLDKSGKESTITILDRTSQKKKLTIDLYMINHKDAIKFGKRHYALTIPKKDVEQ